MYRSVLALLAVAASSVVANTYEVSIAGILGTLVIDADELGGGVDIEGILTAGAVVTLADLPISVPAIPVKHRRQQRRTTGTIGTLTNIGNVFSTLENEVTPILSAVTGLISHRPAGSVQAPIQSQLGSLELVLAEALASLSVLTVPVDVALAEAEGVTAATVAATIAEVYTNVAHTLTEIKSVESQVPILGSILVEGTDKIQTTLTSIVSTVSTLSAPLEATLLTVLAPAEGLLADAGLEAVAGLLGILRQ